MFCSNCGNQIQGGRFCEICGAPISNTSQNSAGSSTNSQWIPVTREPTTESNFRVYSGSDEDTDNVCLVAFLLSFIVPVLGVILCLYGKKHAARTGKRGSTLATVGIVINIVATIIFFFYAVGNYVGSRVPKSKSSDEIVKALHAAGFSDDVINNVTQNGITAVYVDLYSANSDGAIAYAYNPYMDYLTEGVEVFEETAGIIRQAINEGNFAGTHKEVHEEKYAYYIYEGTAYDHGENIYVFGGIYLFRNTVVTIFVGQEYKQEAQIFLKKLGYPYFQ